MVQWRAVRCIMNEYTHTAASVADTESINLPTLQQCCNYVFTDRLYEVSQIVNHLFNLLEIIISYYVFLFLSSCTQYIYILKIYT